MQGEQIREALDKHCRRRRRAARTRNTTFTRTMSAAIISNQGSEVLDDRVWKVCEAITPGTRSGLNVKRILGEGDLWIMESTITYPERPAYNVSTLDF